jgi:uncharacterized integral membrane protein
VTIDPIDPQTPGSPQAASGGEPDAAATPPVPSSGSPRRERIERTRLSGTYKSLIAGTLVLVLLLVFILENTKRVKVTYFGVSGHLALGVALLFAAVAGALIVGIVGSARIIQLRKRAKRTRP